MGESDNQTNNTKPWLWKKGQSGNPAGRPKGKSMKEYARDYLAGMSDEERDDFMDGIPKETIWKMGEGNPITSADITTQGEKIVVDNDKFKDLETKFNAFIKGNNPSDPA